METTHGNGVSVAFVVRWKRFIPGSSPARRAFASRRSTGSGGLPALDMVVYCLVTLAFCATCSW